MPSRVTRSEFILISLCLLFVLLLISSLLSLFGDHAAVARRTTVHQIELKSGTGIEDSNSIAEVAAEDVTNPADDAWSQPSSPVIQQNFAKAEKDEDDNSIEAEVSFPVAWLELPASEPSSDEEINQLSCLREQFVELLGGENQDPADPGYRVRWSIAQKEVDEEFMSLFGQEAFNRRQLRMVAPPGNGL